MDYERVLHDVNHTFVIISSSQNKIISRYCQDDSFSKYAGTFVCQITAELESYVIGKCALQTIHCKSL